VKSECDKPQTDELRTPQRNWLINSEKNCATSVSNYLENKDETHLCSLRSYLDFKSWFAELPRFLFGDDSQ
jgi:hypothetical protein